MAAKCRVALTIPCLRSISITPAEITAGKGLGLRAACAITMQDFPHSDIRIDPYVASELIYRLIEALILAN